MDLSTGFANVRLAAGGNIFAVGTHIDKVEGGQQNGSIKEHDWEEL